jgi:hypothetical protein
MRFFRLLAMTNRCRKTLISNFSLEEHLLAISLFLFFYFYQFLFINSLLLIPDITKCHVQHLDCLDICIDFKVWMKNMTQQCIKSISKMNIFCFPIKERKTLTYKCTHQYYEKRTTSPTVSAALHILLVIIILYF